MKTARLRDRHARRARGGELGGGCVRRAGGDPGRRLASPRSRHARVAARRARPARRRRRSLHRPLGCRRTRASGHRARPSRPRLRLAFRRLGAAGPPTSRNPAARDPLRDATMGERRSGSELGADGRPAVRRLRACNGDALLVGSPVEHLERAEQAAVASPDVGGHVRPEAPEPGVRADPRRDRRGARRWRHDRATGRHRRRVAGRVDQGHGFVATEARRLRPPSLPRTPPARDPVGTGVPDLRDHRDGGPRAPRHARPPAARAQADLAHRVRLPDESS